VSQRNRKGGGTVFWDEDRGCYTGQLSHYNEAGNRKRPKVHAATKAECWEKLDELRAELKKTGSVAPRDLTVADLVSDLLAHPPADWKSPLTLINRRNYAARIVAGLGTAKVARLTVAQVERFLADAATEGLSADMLRRLRSTLRLAIRRAERDGKATRNVAALAEIPAGPRRWSKSMNLEEIRALLGLKLTTWWRAYLTCALMCGLRPGELLGLRWEDIDFGAGVIRVRKFLKTLPDPVTGKRVLVLADLKTERSKRTIRMPGQVSASLLALRKEQAATRLQLGAGSDVRGLGVVFGDGAGAPKWSQDVRSHFQTLCGRPGIGKDWTPRERAVGLRGGHRADRRRRRARQLDGDQGRVPPPDRRRDHLSGDREGWLSSARQRAPERHRLRSLAPESSMGPYDLRRYRFSVTPCEGNGSRSEARKVP
jgi:integrase